MEVGVDADEDDEEDEEEEEDCAERGGSNRPNLHQKSQDVHVNADTWRSERLSKTECFDDVSTCA